MTWLISVTWNWWRKHKTNTFDWANLQHPTKSIIRTTKIVSAINIFLFLLLLLILLKKNGYRVPSCHSLIVNKSDLRICPRKRSIIIASNKANFDFSMRYFCIKKMHLFEFLARWQNTYKTKRENEKKKTARNCVLSFWESNKSYYSFDFRSNLFWL